MKDGLARPHGSTILMLPTYVLRTPDGWVRVGAPDW